MYTTLQAFTELLVNANIQSTQKSDNHDSSSAQHCRCQRDVYVCEAVIITTVKYNDKNTTNTNQW